MSASRFGEAKGAMFYVLSISKEPRIQDQDSLLPPLKDTNEDLQGSPPRPIDVLQRKKNSLFTAKLPGVLSLSDCQLLPVGLTNGPPYSTHRSPKKLSKQEALGI